MFTEEELKRFAEANVVARKYKNGTIWETKNYGKIEIIGINPEKNCYICRFIETGSIYTCSGSSISQCQIKDYNKQSIYGKGFMGEGVYSKKTHTEIYGRWISMLARCYSEKYHKERPTYKDCEVSEEWLNFQNFAKDIEDMMREKGITSLKGYCIDKDLKVKGNKLYSKDTVSIITGEENEKEKNERNPNITGETYKATRLSDGYEEIFYNQCEFARKYNLYQGNIYKCIYKKRNKTGGWKFEVINE